MTIDFQKTLDSLNDCFLLVVLCKYGFEENFIDWVKILLKYSNSWRSLYKILFTSKGGSTKGSYLCVSLCSCVRCTFCFV